MNEKPNLFEQIQDHKHGIKTNFDDAKRIMNEIEGMSENGELISNHVIAEKHQDIRDHVTKGCRHASDFSETVQEMRDNE
jgi:hypothetical protein